MKITFIGAGSTVFAKNVLGDCILTPELGKFEVALFDIDAKRNAESFALLSAINKKYDGNADIQMYSDPEKAFAGADYVINAIQVGGYEPCTVTDFEIPKKYGLRQTIADTLGIGGIFRALRTIPVMEKYARIIEKKAPRALFLNYTNPMSMLSGYMQRYTDVPTVGLCHSVQACVPLLSEWLNLPELKADDVSWKIAGINHMAWLLEIKDRTGKDLYPLIKKAFKENPPKRDLVRGEMLARFGYYNTESSEHTAEYHAWFIKNRYPALIERFNIPLDEYPRRCVSQIKGWQELRDKLTSETELEHTRSLEYGSRIIQAAETDVPCRIHGNVQNAGLITNLPPNACVEVPVMVDRNGFNPCVVGALPEQLAALNRTNINVQLLTIQAAKSRKKEDIYMAAYMDPHTAAELSLDDIKSLCDDLIEAHGAWLPKYN
ncbi:MAG: alpha-glucosidase/alpha-galactosidase [Clostridiales bacterium]|jgi:alpha-galactosidase|nr:alpha-glucosidase/alpha-galactosidase [Clostridiales bacterium]